jgi:hypothetical protein
MRGAREGAFAMIYGKANLVHCEVWAYQANPQQVFVGDPIDLSRRLDGNQMVRLGQPLLPHFIAASSSSRETVAKLVAESLMA